MNLKDFMVRLLGALRKTTKMTRIAAGVVLVVLIIGFVASFGLSKKGSTPLLFDRALTVEEYGTITAALEQMGIEFTTKDDKYILVKDDETGRNIRMKLAQEGKMPSTIKSWELFDMESWTTTEFDRNVKLRRALIGQITKHIESLDWIEKANVSITMPEKKLYTQEEVEVSAAMSIVPSPGFRDYLKDKKKIKGIEMIVLRGIDKLKKENIVITDDQGNLLNDFSGDELDEKLRQATEERKIVLKEEKVLEEKIGDSLLGLLPADRFRVTVDLDYGFDRKKETTKEVLPVVVKPKSQGLPYDDSQVLPSVKVSERDTTEEFKGQGLIPEGPPGQEPNIPPGYKDNVDRWNTYNKNDKLNNYVNGERNTEVVNDAVDILAKSVAVVVDGTWDYKLDAKGNKIVQGLHYLRTYTPVSTDDLAKLEDVVRAQMGYNVRRGDRVAVSNIAFDRTSEFDKVDGEMIRAENAQRSLIYGLLALLVLGAFFVVFRIIRNEMIRRRRIRALELERQRQREMEESLRTLMDDEKVSGDQERSVNEVFDKIVNVIDREPEMVAKILKYWIME